MKLYTKAQLNKLQRNAAATEASDGADLGHQPVVKLFTPWGGATWLLSEIEPDGDRAFGLCDLGHGTPELGYVSLSELASLRGPGGLRVERDRYFTASKSLTDYATEARAAGRIQA